MKTSGAYSDELPVELFERMADVLRVLAHPKRLRIIEILQAETEAPVTA